MSRSLSAGWRYRWLTRAVSVVLIGHAIWKMCASRDTRFLFHRLGFGPKNSSQLRWWHAASVGEVQTVWPLLQAMINQNQHRSSADNSLKWLVTTTTTTGYEVLEKRLQQADLSHCVLHAYLPIDTPGFAMRFIRRVNPTAYASVETEIWPNLYTALHNYGVPITIINARVTHKTLATINPNHRLFSTMQPAYSSALNSVTVFSRSDNDAKGYIQLGVNPTQVKVVGDLKFADNRPPHCKALLTNELLTNPYVVAASTHPPEEEMLCDQWIQQTNTGLLVLVPRHVERGKALHHTLIKRYGDVLAPLRSLSGMPDMSHRLYIADTLGELHDWYSSAAAVFVGGSLIERGGHNVLEPFFHRVPVITGPHTNNFTDAVNWLMQQNAITQVNDATETVESLIKTRDNGNTVTQSKNDDLLASYIKLLTRAAYD